MQLAEFRYIDKALSTLDKEREQLEVISKLLQMEFTEIMNLYGEDMIPQLNYKCKKLLSFTPHSKKRVFR